MRLSVLLSLLTLSTASLAQPADLGLGPPPAKPVEAESWNPYQRTDTLVKVGLGFAGAHMIDNFLVRRTFTGATLPQTAVQALYLGAGTAYALDAGPLFWILFSTGMLTAHSLGHLFLPSAENHLPTFHQHWASGSNRLNVRSGAIGRGSQGVLIGLDLSFLLILASSIDDGIRYGFTLKKLPASELSSSARRIERP